jgi:hypothetical protein
LATSVFRRWDEMTVTGMRTGLRANARLASAEGTEGSSLTVTYHFYLHVLGSEAGETPHRIRQKAPNLTSKFLLPKSGLSQSNSRLFASTI